ncbi:MAG: TetR family transcriptional regulator [Spirochaetes bacterium RBG_13_51_14]|nr:MAG: TetR family transcriptional regulator [Spirochaetes bacterium RBG_13_51_14]
MKTLNATHAASKGRKLSVIQAALACFTEKGYSDTSINDVCRMSGASVGSIYHHFKSKEQLAAAVYLEGIRDYQQGFVQELEGHDRARDGVFAIVRFHLTWVERNPDWARFLFQKRYAEFMGDTEEEFSRLNAEFMARVSGWFRKHIGTGSIRRLPPDLYPAIMLGPCQEYSRIYLSGHHATPVKDAVKEIGDAVWLALGAPSAKKERPGANGV